MPAIIPPALPASWADLNANGRREATEIVERIRADKLPMILGHRVKIMIEKGEYGGHEVGFFHQIAVNLIR